MMSVVDLKNNHFDHWKKAAAVRMLSVDAVDNAVSGHQGMPIGFADVATILFEKHLRFDAAAPDWPDRDRLILSAGHGSMLLYSLLYLCGYADMTIKQLCNFRQWKSRTAGHPEYGHAQGIETTTGPLGQGLANAVGFAIAEQALQARFGSELMNHYTYAIVGDGCLMEGISHEAIGLTGCLCLDKLIVLWDNNNISIDGKVTLSDITDQTMRFRAAGWDVFEIDGHDPQAIDQALRQAKQSKKPVMIACKTIIALGVEQVENTPSGHGYAIKGAKIAQMRQFYDWPHKPFKVPNAVLKSWRKIGTRGATCRKQWQIRLEQKSASDQREFKRVFAGDVPEKLFEVIQTLKKKISLKQPKIATRQSSQMVLEAINPIMPETIGGSADLTGSNNTLSRNLGIFNQKNRHNRYIHYGIREHGMAAVMNGLALHGGIRPYGGTFMCFTDYARAAMRLSALMGVPVIYVMTHDSIGLGEDGPTHQPIEHLAMLRATPNTYLFRPADTIETAECWQLAVANKRSPSILSLTRQAVRTVRIEDCEQNLCAKGAYILAGEGISLQVILIATGSEVAIALQAQKILEKVGIGTRVVSMPCWELFADQSTVYRREVLPRDAIRIGIEAAVGFGWDRWLFGEGGRYDRSAFIGMKSFGASAPAQQLYENFGITSDMIISTAYRLLKIEPP